MLVQMIQQDIQRGVPSVVNLCPIAQALLRMGYYCAVSLYTATIWKSDDSQERAFRLPPRASRFILRFDEGKQVQPITFVMQEEAMPWPLTGEEKL